MNGKTLDEVLKSLNTLMAIGNTGDWRLIAVTTRTSGVFSSGSKSPGVAISPCHDVTYAI